MACVYVVQLMDSPDMSFGCTSTLLTVIQPLVVATSWTPSSYEWVALNGSLLALEQRTVFMRDVDDAFAQCSFIYGSSHNNQRIDSRWSFLRKHCTQHWMNTFQDLKDTNVYVEDFLGKNLSQLCFMIG